MELIMIEWPVNQMKASRYWITRKGRISDTIQNYDLKELEASVTR
jgi:hypothetical protein